MQPVPSAAHYHPKTNAMPRYSLPFIAWRLRRQIASGASRANFAAELRAEIASRLRAHPPGRGNHAWRRADKLDRGAFHIAGCLYLQ